MPAHPDLTQTSALAWTAVMTAVLTISWALQPLDKSFAGFLNLCSTGSTASTPARLSFLSISCLRWAIKLVGLGTGRRSDTLSQVTGQSPLAAAPARLQQQTLRQTQLARSC